ncbi:MULTISPECIES: type II secretion system F family protein [unclassified Psychrobacillus]|uniref:type II secretion system F family protein n=1 Tax=unclassified Psychrobacillus TaxID=2636677 RepID=UPI0030FA96CD
MEMKWLVLLFMVVFLWMFARNILVLVFSLENYKIHKKRLKQLNFQRKDDADISEIIGKVTNPFEQFFSQRYSVDRLEVTWRKIKLAKWDKVFKSPLSFIVFLWLLRVVGVFFAVILWSASPFFASMWGGALILLPAYLFYNSTSNRVQRLISEFPEFIRIMEGYLTAGLTFSTSVQESIRYVGDEWKPILQKLAVDIELMGVDDALEAFKFEVDLFEVREFVSLLKLTLEQGGDPREGFESQAERIKELSQLNIEMKIQKRTTMGIMIQAPMLICLIMVIGLPTIDAMMNMNL